MQRIQAQAQRGHAVTALPHFLAEKLQRTKCVDVGTCGGLQGSWARFRDFIETDALEPHPVACERSATRPGEHWFPIGLAGSGKHSLHVLGKPSGSSLYPPNPPMIGEFTTESYRRLNKRVEIDALSVSDFIRKQTRTLPDLIKFDT